jgi:multidrug efflux pump subunit AcrA (membrane-fusion protein)
VLLIPRAAVFLRDSGPVVWARRALRWSEVPVTLGRSNRREVEVTAGVAEGETLSPVDLALPKERQAAAASGSAG